MNARATHWAPSVALCVLFGAACGTTTSSPPAPEDASIADTNPVDAGPINFDGALTDAAIPLGPDGSDTGTRPVDADADAGTSFACDSCAPPGPCEILSCEASCEYRVSADGQSCSDGVCIEGACEERRCGDGWRERGDTAFPREACDDGNSLEDDGCSTTCQPRPIVVARNDEGHRDWTTRGATAALDDAGNLLVVWTRERPGGEDATAVLARRFDLAA